MIIDIRGTNGSGKSTLVHSLINVGRAEDVWDEEGALIGHWVPKYNLAVTGHYDRACGGTDTIKSAEAIESRIRLLNDNFDIVVAEGIMMSHTFQRYHDLATELDNYHFCFLSTPLDLCIKRVIQRRKKKGNTKPFNEKWLRSDYHRIWQTTRKKMVEHNHNVHVLDCRTAFSQLLKLIKTS